MNRLILVMLCWTSVPARADTPPWAAGVSESDKTRAQVLLERGNTLFLEKNYADALTSYRDAVAAWDHPAIRFNIVRCLIQLDRPAEASENLTAALKYGAAPLEEAVYREALTYGKLLAKQVGDLVITCDQAGVTMTLDGQPLAACPARETRRLAVGPHHVVATKRDFAPETLEIIAVGGELREVTVSLEPLDRSGGRRFYGKLMTVNGVGLVVIASGLALWGWRRYEAQFPRHCGGERLEIDGKPACDEVGAAAIDRAQLYGDVASVVGVVGMAVALTGAIVIWRSPRRERRTVVGPAASGAGISVSGSF